MMTFAHGHTEKIHKICTYPADPINILFVWVTENDFYLTTLLIRFLQPLETKLYINNRVKIRIVMSSSCFYFMTLSATQTV
jgi:hypothetical protein